MAKAYVRENVPLSRFGVLVAQLESIVPSAAHKSPDPLLCFDLLSDLISAIDEEPKCGHCKNLSPEYEKAASILSSYDPPIILAKVDANEEANKELASQFQVQGYPIIKILRNGGKNAQDYKGPREADGIVAYLKKQVGPASAEIKSVEDASNVIDEKKITLAS